MMDIHYTFSKDSLTRENLQQLFLSDGALTAYFHYVLTMPQYQGKGIGRQLMVRILERYAHYGTKVLITYPKAQTFYERLGFEVEEASVPMYLVSRKK